MGHVGEDDRWKKFQAFHDYLEKAFPRTHAKLGLTKVNTYGLVFEWKGSDPSLKPVLLMGHQGQRGVLCDGAMELSQADVPNPYARRCPG